MFKARLLVTNDGWSDVYPTRGYYLKETDIPFFYLRHGISRYKTNWWNASHYDGRILRFVVSLDSEFQIAVDELMSKEDSKLAAKLDVMRGLVGLPRSTFSRQGIIELREALSASLDIGAMKTREAEASLKLTIQDVRRLIDRIGFPAARVIRTGMARHDELASLVKDGGSSRRYITFFFTWRDYWPNLAAGADLRNTEFFKNVQPLIFDDVFQQFLKDNDMVARIYVHQKMHAYGEALREISGDRIEIRNGSSDMRQSMVESAAFVTDYSSAAFDFSLGGSGVLFYQPDQERYYQSRGDYTTEQRGWIGPVITDHRNFVDALKEAIGGAPAQRDRVVSEYPNFGKSLPAIACEIDSIPPRVTFVCFNIFGIGGTVRSTVNSANYLHQKGYHVEIISLRQSSARPTLDLDPAIRIRSLFPSFKGGKSLSKWQWLISRLPSILFDKNEDAFHRINLLIDMRLAKTLRSITADVIIPTIPSLGRAAVWFSRKKSAVLIQEHKFFEAHKPSVQKLIARSYGKADGLLTLTDLDGVAYEAATGMKSFTVPNGVRTFENHNGGSAIRPRVIALGRLDPQKQFDLLIRAFEKISSSNPEWDLHIFGQGNHRAELEGLVNKLGLTGRVFMRGATAEGGSEMALAQICAVSSSFEGFGMTFVEAYSLGKPVITFDIERGPKEIVIDGVTGLKAKPFDIDDYAQKLERLMRDRRLREELGKNAKELWNHRYRMDVTGQKLEEAISAVAKK